MAAFIQNGRFSKIDHFMKDGLQGSNFEHNFVTCPKHRPNRLRFVLPISSHVTIPLGSFSIILLFAFMAQLRTVRNMSERSKDVLSRD